jgi:hypothetical protein
MMPRQYGRAEFWHDFIMELAAALSLVVFAVYTLVSYRKVGLWITLSLTLCFLIADAVFARMMFTEARTLKEQLWLNGEPTLQLKLGNWLWSLNDRTIRGKNIILCQVRLQGWMGFFLKRAWPVRQEHAQEDLHQIELKTGYNLASQIERSHNMPLAEC